MNFFGFHSKQEVELFMSTNIYYEMNIHINALLGMHLYHILSHNVINASIYQVTKCFLDSSV